MRTVSNLDAFKSRATYEDGDRVKKITPPDPNAEFKAILAQLKELTQTIAQLAHANTNTSDTQKRGVLDLIQNQNSVIQNAIEAFSQRPPQTEPLDCTFRVTKRDAKGKVLEFTVKEN